MGDHVYLDNVLFERGSSKLTFKSKTELDKIIRFSEDEYAVFLQNKKKEILDKMVAKAEELGASALMDIKYQVYTTKDANGYTFSGTAIRYVLK